MRLCDTGISRAKVTMNDLENPRIFCSIVKRFVGGDSFIPHNEQYIQMVCP